MVFVLLLLELLLDDDDFLNRRISYIFVEAVVLLELFHSSGDSDGFVSFPSDRLNCFL